MKENLDLIQILFDELIEFPRKRLGISIRAFCAEAHVGTATYSKAKKKEHQPPKPVPPGTRTMLRDGRAGVHGVWGRGAQGGV